MQGGRTYGSECAGGRVGVQGGREGRTGDLGVLEVEVEFKEYEHVVLSVLEVEVEFKEDEHVVLSMLEVELEFKEEEDEEQAILGCWRARWSSRTPPNHLFFLLFLLELQLDLQHSKPHVHPP